jgi:LAS superfamily LD-carboxypeptidase LdcB
MTSAFNIDDLLWGTLNNFEDTLHSNSGDPRRGDPREWLNAALNMTYGRNTLQDVHGFYGIVFAALDSYQVSTAQKAGLLRDYSQIPRDPFSNWHTAYKVYIPELEPSPPPASMTDPILWFYPNVFPTEEIGTRGQLTPGTIVRVEYQDLQNLIEPTIVSVEGTVAMAMPSTQPKGLAFKFKEAPSIPAGGATVDPGEFSWSNGAKQLTSKHIPTGRTIKNGEVPADLLKKDPETGVLLLPNALIDFQKMHAAFKKKFGESRSFKVSGGYRTYESQVSVRMIRVLGDKAGCPAKATGKKANVSGKLGEGGGQFTYKDGRCIFKGYAATPGRSKHGWGAAVDITGLTDPEFEWINKFGLDKYRFVFGVSGERWHLNWTGLKTELENPPTFGFARKHELGKDGALLPKYKDVTFA